MSPLVNFTVRDVALPCMAPSAAPLCTVGSGALRILPNLKKHSINFPHQTDTDGIFVQTKTVKTVVRVGYADSTLPAHAMRVAMSLHDGFGEITADRVTTNGKPLYKSPVGALELRSDVPVLPEDESDGGVARAACVAEATFEFTFNVTAAADIDRGTKATQVRLHFAVEDAPSLCVATTPFRLVAKKDPVRESVQTLMASALTLSKQVLYREGP